MSSTIQQPPYSPASGTTDPQQELDSTPGQGVSGISVDTSVAGGVAGTAAALRPGKQDPFAKDAAARQTGPNAMIGEVGNKEPLDPEYSQVSVAFKGNGVTPPTEQQVRTTAAWAQNHPQVQELVDGVKLSTKSGGSPPSVSQYAAVQPPATDANQQAKDMAKTMADGLLAKTVDDIGKAKTGGNGGEAIAKGGSVSALIMFVMLQAKKELQADKADDLAQMKKYTTISDLMNQHLSNVLGPANQAIMDKAVGKAGGVGIDDKKTQKADTKNVKVEVDTPDSFNIDVLNSKPDGSPALAADYGQHKDKQGNLVENNHVKTVDQTELTNITQNFQNQLQQVQSRIQRQQTSYQGHDSQDSTLSNIITAVNKTFSESASAIVRNVQ